MLFAVLAGFLLAFLLFSFAHLLKGFLWRMLSLLPLSLFVWFLTKGLQGGIPEESHDWIPSLGIALSFRLDGLALIFTLLITGIGTLVFAYASSYLKGHRYLGRFYAYLSLFMGSMLGLVLSDNVLSLFVFWELTSISSFFLIGFNNEEKASRKSAMVALAITGGGGLFLLAGLLLLGQMGGGYEISDWRALAPEVFREHALYIPAVLLVLVGAFTKSAQFPFHFWLPGAMKAPTPVSTYLHSATMVKAGVFLVARMNPILGDTPLWEYTLIIVGGITMFFGAFHSIFRTDLKSILAYSTISALGILMFLIGLASPYAWMAAGVFIIVHALYKAALFLITGIIDHAVHSRDITKISGLGHVMAPVALAGFISALSSAGMPPFMGFVGKDLIYEATLHHDWRYWLTALALISNVFLLVAGFFAGIRPFIGNLSHGKDKLHLPDAWLFVPPAILALGSLTFGLFPSLIDATLVRPMASSIGSGEWPTLKLWHGFNLVLALSALTLGLGFLLYRLIRPGSKWEGLIQPLDALAPARWFEGFYRLFRSLAHRVTCLLLHGYLRHYVYLMVFFLVALLFWKIAELPDPIDLDFQQVTELTFYEGMIIVVMLFAMLLAVFSNNRLGSIASMSVVGFSICLLFLFFSAPDLAMTQFAIETLTLVMFLLIIFRLPKYLVYSAPLQRAKDGVLALGLGTAVFLIAMSVLNQESAKEITAFYAENAYALAKGKNVVNVILVDFRGIDTMIEIVVLSIAAVGVFSLLKLNKESKEDLEA